MDDLARRYLLLTLRLSRLRTGLLTAYLGPAELAEVVAGERPTSARELHDEALRLHEGIADQRAGSSANGTRARWLGAQLTALSAAARTLAGDEIALPELVEQLLDLPAEREPETSLAAAHRLLDAALPRGPSLRARLAEHRRETVVPSEQVGAVAHRFIALLRARCLQDLALPNGESLLLEPWEVAGGTWDVRMAATGPRETRLELNLAIDWPLDTLLRSVAAESYPGRHAQRVSRHHAAAEEADRWEASAWCLATPEAALADGLGVVGRQAVLGDYELSAELRRIGREVGLHIDVERDLEVGRGRRLLAPAVANAALLLHQDGLPAPEVRGYLAEMGLLTEREVDRVMERLADPLLRVEPFSRAYAPQLVSEWLQVTGQTNGVARLLREQLTPGLLRDEAA
ncbi:MAG: hypothetical protein M3O77_01015 [Chloroflexota bacterium]|nr:hypothetical protein [Chloroflexota bacterium]